MLKSSASEKVSYHIPDDLTFSILSKLPLKSLKRFTSVRKSFSHLFQNPNFMSIYGNNFMSRNNHSYEYEEGSSFLLQQTQADFPILQELYLLSGENKIKLDWPHPFQEEEKQVIYILGPVINGIVCLYKSDEPCAVLWNPATQESKVLPYSPTQSPVFNRDERFYHHGFGYDHVTDDYKVIRYVYYFDDASDGRENTWEIYSLRNNSWKKLDFDMPHGSLCPVGAFVYMKGVCHWYDEGWNGNKCLVSFDLSNEVFSTTPMPSDMNDSADDVYVRRHLLVLNDHIAFISNYLDTTTFHISILGELGVKESWTKIFILGPLSCIVETVGVGENGDLFFRRKDDELVWFNWSTQMIKELGIKGKSSFCQIVIYKESFLRIGQIND